jgi:beta-glucanase (GH16 family)
MGAILSPEQQSNGVREWSDISKRSSRSRRSVSVNDLKRAGEVEGASGVSASPRESIAPSESAGEGRGSLARRTTRNQRFLLVIAILAVITTISVVASRKSPTGPTTGLSLAFNQTFTGNKLDTTTWNTCYPWAVPSTGCTNFGNTIQDEWYLPSGDKVSDGALHIVATETPTSGTTKSGAPTTFSYKSGMVTTHHSFNFRYGYVQVVAKIPGGTGTWPALWLLPKNQTWPPEIDIMENWGSAHRIQTTLYWGTSDKVTEVHKKPVSRVSLTKGYRTYGLLWKRGSLTWYLDGKVVDRYRGSNVPSQPMYFLANLAIDGAATSGSSFDIRSVQIYK